MKILIASDKFKGSLSSLDVGQAIKNGVNNIVGSECIIHPVADGGDGSLEVLESFLNLEKVHCQANDPLGRIIDSFYYSNDHTAYVELAIATGLVRLNENERNPMHTSTYGTGQQILDAIHTGNKIIYLFLGGSSTNDCGTGIASALGYRFLDSDRNILSPTGMNLKNIRYIDDEEFKYRDIEFRIVCDVNNPLYGEKGAAKVYAKQKGASQDEINWLDDGLRNFAQLIRDTRNIDINQIAGAGAAGGIGAGLTALMNAEMIGGFQFMSELTNLEEAIKTADIVISGEGKIDESSLHGKVINGISGLCKRYQKPLYLFCGAKEITAQSEANIGVEKVYAIMDIADTRDEAMSKSSLLLSQLASAFAREVLLQ
ncbi:MAG: glycerate kinase [Saprospiraceae bacterium]|nr:glycerate kinase [Saprospiraceae bacterium]